MKPAVLTPAAARAALAQASVDALADLLCYAEGVALVVSGVGVAVETPEEIARRAVEDPVDQRAPWSPQLGTFLAHLRRLVRLRIGERLLRHARLRGGTRDPWEAQLAGVQLGSLRGVEQLAHYAGEMAPSLASTRRRTACTTSCAVGWRRGRPTAATTGRRARGRRHGAPP